MTDNKTVMKQALALIADLEMDGDYAEGFWARRNESVAALRAAIAQPVQPTAQEPRTEAEIVALAYTLSGCKYCPERSGEVAFKYDLLQAFALAIAQPQPESTK